MSATEIFQRLKSLSPVQQRKAAAVLGALLADAAAAPLHWIYDQEKVATLIEKEGTVEFYPQSQCPFYTIDTGNNSTYGDELYVTLKCIAENKGFYADKLADAIYKQFGPGTIYEKARTQSGYPVNGPWTNHCVKIFVANRENGTKPDADTKNGDPDGLTKAIAVAAVLSGNSGLLDATVKCVQTNQLNPVAIGYALGGIRILDHVIQTGEDGVDAAIQALKDPDRALKYENDAAVVADMETAKANTKPHPVAAKEYGLACGFPASFKGMVQGVSHAKDYKEMVRSGIRAAGDNCSRNNFIGACAAARYGLDSIPTEWFTKYPKAAEILGYIETIVQL